MEVTRKWSDAFKMLADHQLSVWDPVQGKDGTKVFSDKHDSNIVLLVFLLF